MVTMMSSSKQIDQGFISDICVSTMFNPVDMKQIMNNHNMLCQQIGTFDQHQIKLKQEIEDLKSTLSKELSKEQPDIKEITDKIVKQELDVQQQAFEQEKEQLQKDLLNRVDKVLKLEMQLDEAKDAYRQLENSISRDDLKFKQKAQSLEKNLDQIHQMYQNVTSEKSILKVDL